MHFIIIVAAALLSVITFAQEHLVCDYECRKSCDDVCQAALQSMFQAEASQWVGDIESDPFFTTPANISASEPGDILRWEDIPASQLATKWTIPASLSLSRFLYVSKDGQQQSVPASGWVLLPYSSSNANGNLRTVVWAHGTAGRSRQCAPTNYKTLYTEWQAPFFLAEMGYAVIAPDYSGQGSSIPEGFMYEAGAVHAADVAYAVIAVRNVLGNILSQRWAVYGHSEGGLTAWRTNERLARADQQDMRLRTGEFVGAVAVAPALRPVELISKSLSSRAIGEPAKNPYAVYFLQTISQLYPDNIRISDYLGDVAMHRMGVLDRSCSRTGSEAVGNLTVTQLFKNVSWLSHPVMSDWRRRYNNEGPHPLAAPMLVLHGANDNIVPANSALEDVNQTCVAYPDSAMHVRLYPNMGHGQVVDAGKPDVLAWLSARFAAEASATAGCQVEVVKPVTDRHGQTKVIWTGRADPD